MRKQFTATVEKLSKEGFGIVYQKNHPVLLPQTIPGEKVKYFINKAGPNYSYGEVSELLEAAPYRVNPACGYFGSCGGCSLQHIDYSQQLKIKMAYLSDALMRVGMFAEADLSAIVRPIEPAINELHYRRKVNLKANSNGELGFYQSGSHVVVPIERCELVDEAINQYLPQMRERVLQKVSEKVRNYELDFELKLIDGQVHPTDRSSSDFIQVNAEMNKLLKSHVELALSEIKINNALELFAGAGNFTEIIAAHTTSLVAVESNELAVRKAKSWLKAAGLAHVQFIQEFSHRYFKKTSQPNFDLVFLDPPRAGAAEAIPGILQSKAKYIFYVSCNAESLARDLRTLVDANYKITSIRPYDFFAQTPHLETFVVLNAA